MIFGTHDIIYRRVRNDKLSKEYHYAITDFQREKKPIEYFVEHEQKNHRIVHNLPETFCLDDHEVCWGKWPQHATVLLKSKKRYANGKTLPLLVLRSYANGHLIWMNSGDKDKELCGSIAVPGENFVRVIANALGWKSEMPDVILS